MFLGVMLTFNQISSIVTSEFSVTLRLGVLSVSLDSLLAPCGILSYLAPAETTSLQAIEYIKIGNCAHMLTSPLSVVVSEVEWCTVISTLSMR